MFESVHSEATRIEMATPQQREAAAEARARTERMARGARPDPGVMSPADWQREQRAKAAERANVEDAILAEARRLRVIAENEEFLRVAQEEFESRPPARPAIRPESRTIKIEEIQRTVAAHYSIRRVDITSARRTADIVRPRMVAVWLSKRLTSRSLPYIGRLFGGRDHTTILHSIRRIEQLRQSDPQLAAQLAEFERILQPVEPVAAVLGDGGA